MVRTVRQLWLSRLWDFASEPTLANSPGFTAVSRVSAAQPDAFWLACDRGCDTLFAHDSARQKKCLDLHDSPFVRVNAVVSIIALSGFA